MGAVLDGIRITTNALYALSSTLECLLRLRKALGLSKSRSPRLLNNSFTVEFRSSTNFQDGNLWHQTLSRL